MDRERKEQDRKEADSKIDAARKSAMESGWKNTEANKRLEEASNKRNSSSLTSGRVVKSGPAIGEKNSWMKDAGLRWAQGRNGQAIRERIPIYKDELRTLIADYFPNILKPLLNLGFLKAGDKPNDLVARLQNTGVACWEVGSAESSVKGTKGLYKGQFLRGYTRSSLTDAWPDEPDDPAVEATKTYSTDGSGLSSLFLTWDYVRAH